MKARKSILLLPYLLTLPLIIFANEIREDNFRNINSISLGENEERIPSKVIRSIISPEEKKTESDKKEEINWISLEKAQILTKENPKTVFIDVYTDWCGWCKVMDKMTFKDQKVIKYVNKHYYAVKLNAESMEEVVFNGVKISKAELAKALGVTSYPTIVLINEKFDMVAPAPGYRKAKEFKELLEKFKNYTLKGGNEK
ncbi:thioredoxin family protein [Xanthovirga aplysinae]|uniref:thioredoxin family protein n=1 Tax=Xanthovirga aplysinae TaxID=2529853 RepID=UPI0012BB5ACD|nr:thioredoxin fold domain-containing protein [Xanthovirga aplysinae]MTI29742.1 thioredoxin family protein [Xanthovirga aplysinae]